MQKLSLIVPTYNEEESLPALFAVFSELHLRLNEFEVGLEVIAVDNCSSDSTWEILRGWASDAKGIDSIVVQHPVNLGMQQSLLTGLRLSGGDAIAVMQSDLQDPPELVVKMVKEWLSGAKFVATRIQRREGSIVPRVGAWLFYRLLSLVSDDRVIPDSSDFYLFDSALRKALIQESGTTPFLRASLSATARPDVVIRYQRLDREGGTTNFSLKRRVNFALDALLRDVGGLVKKAISLAIFIGALSFASLLSLALGYLFGYRSPVAGWISTMGVLLLMLSTTMSIGSVTLELLARIYRDIPRQDLSLDSEVIRFEQS